MNKTKEYIIKITGNNAEHLKAKKCIENLFKELNQDLEGNIELYIQSFESPKNWGNWTWKNKNLK